MFLAGCRALSCKERRTNHFRTIPSGARPLRLLSAYGIFHGNVSRILLVGRENHCFRVEPSVLRFPQTRPAPTNFESLMYGCGTPLKVWWWDCTVGAYGSMDASGTSRRELLTNAWLGALSRLFCIQKNGERKLSTGERARNAILIRKARRQKIRGPRRERRDILGNLIGYFERNLVMTSVSGLIACVHACSFWSREGTEYDECVRGRYWRTSSEG